MLYGVVRFIPRPFVQTIFSVGAVGTLGCPSASRPVHCRSAADGWKMSGKNDCEALAAVLLAIASGSPPPPLGQDRLPTLSCSSSRMRFISGRSVESVSSNGHPAVANNSGSGRDFPRRAPVSERGGHPLGHASTSTTPAARPVARCRIQYSKRGRKRYGEPGATTCCGLPPMKPAACHASHVAGIHCGVMA